MCASNTNEGRRRQTKWRLRKRDFKIIGFEGRHFVTFWILTVWHDFKLMSHETFSIGWTTPTLCTEWLDVNSDNSAIHLSNCHANPDEFQWLENADVSVLIARARVQLCWTIGCHVWWLDLKMRLLFFNSNNCCWVFKAKSFCRIFRKEPTKEVDALVAVMKSEHTENMFSCMSKTVWDMPKDCTLVTVEEAVKMETKIQTHSSQITRGKLFIDFNNDHPVFAFFLLTPETWTSKVFICVFLFLSFLFCLHPNLTLEQHAQSCHTDNEGWMFHAKHRKDQLAGFWMLDATDVVNPQHF